MVGAWQGLEEGQQARSISFLTASKRGSFFLANPDFRTSLSPDHAASCVLIGREQNSHLLRCYRSTIRQRQTFVDELWRRVGGWGVVT